jgi:chemotaxis signal transduction protein
VQTPDARERYMLASFGQTRCAIPLSQIERIVANPKVHSWPGRGLVQGYVHVEGWLVWILPAGQLFSDLGSAPSLGDWLLVLKEDEGLTRSAVLATEVKGPVSALRLDQTKCLTRRSEDALDEFR